jgi:hypothetical protein
MQHQHQHLKQLLADLIRRGANDAAVDEAVAVETMLQQYLDDNSEE